MPLQFRRDVEGLRAVAVLCVVLYHARIAGLSGGFVGVDVFFVISGFLITRLLWAEIEQRGRLELAAFYARRARRLLPAALLVVVATAAVSVAVLSPLRSPGVLRDAFAAVGYVVNYRFAAQRTDYLAVHTGVSPFQHFWSLAVEEQFYLCWPVLLVVAAGVGRRRRGAPLALIGTASVASFGACVWLTQHAQPWAFFSLPTRVWELGVGALLALAAPALRRVPQAVAAAAGWAGLGAIAWAATQLNDGTVFPGAIAAVPVVGAAAVLAAGTRESTGGPVLLLRLAPLQWTGRISYSWYLWHWPLLILLPNAVDHPLGAAARVDLVLLSGVLAGLTYVLLEDPARHARWLLNAPPRRTLTAGVAAMALAAVAVTGASWQIPPLQGTGVAAGAGRLTAARMAPLSAELTPLQRATVPVERALQAATTLTDLPANLAPPLDRALTDGPGPDRCTLLYQQTHLPSCVFGDAASTRTVILYGDSHAAQWLPALLPAAAHRHLRLEVLTKALCPPITPTVIVSVQHRPHVYRECTTFRREVLHRVAAERPALVILSFLRDLHAGNHLRPYDRQWLQGLADTVRSLRASGAQVLVLGPSPLPRISEPDCLAEHLDDVQACARPRAQAVDAAGEYAERRAVQAADGTYSDVARWMCGSRTCPAVIGNIGVYRDDNHVTGTFAQWLAPVFDALLDDVLTAR